ncbi:MAG: DsrE/DsrF/DrsH-like family protein [Desulfosoma sp.]
MADQGQKNPEEKISCTFICSRDTLDGAYPSLVLGLNAVRLGMEATIFYTFMGINVIRKNYQDKCRFIPPGPLGAIPGMSAMATKMMRQKMDAAHIPSLGELLEMAQIEGIRLVACKMTVDMMGLSQNDFIDGVEIQTAEDYLKHAIHCRINMFT